MRPMAKWNGSVHLSQRFAPLHQFLDDIHVSRNISEYERKPDFCGRRSLLIAADVEGILISLADQHHQ